MKPIGRTITKLSLAVMLFAGLAHAQFNAWVVNVNVPFEFTVGKKTFPAGDYSVVRTAPYRLALRDSRAGVVAMVMTMPVQTATPRAEPTLVFRTEGGEHVLVRVWFANSPYGNELTPTKPRLAMAKVQTGDQAGQP
jgi:hypothetical protein